MDDNRLEILQQHIQETLGETKFGRPVSLNLPGGQTIVYRRRQYEGRPEAVSYGAARAEARKAQYKRSQAQVECWNKMSGKKPSLVERKHPTEKMRITGSSVEFENDLMDNFPLAYELVEYVQGGGAVNNISRMMSLKPPKIHGIEDMADSIDWHLLNKGINAEHIETALSKDGNKVLLFMDDRAKPRIPVIKEILTKYGEPRILQKADEMNETTGQPHGFYVFEMVPDTAMFQAKEKDDKSNEWDEKTPQPELSDSLIDDEDEVLLEDVYEPYCSTCGEELFEVLKASKKLKARLEAKKWKFAQKFKPSERLAMKGMYDSLHETDSKSEMASKVKFSRKAKKLTKKGVPTARSDTGTTFNMDSLDDVDNLGETERTYGPGGDLATHLKSQLGIPAAFAAGAMTAHYGRKAYQKFKKRRGKRKLHPAMHKWKSSESFDARVGDPKGKKRKDHPSTLGDGLNEWRLPKVDPKTGKLLPGQSSEMRAIHRILVAAKKKTKKELKDDIACHNCGTLATEIDEHIFSGIYCARHGDRLDKYSKACYECQKETTFLENIVVACPDCQSQVTMEDEDCKVCGTIFMEDEVTDYAEALADNLVPYEDDDDLIETEYDWDDPYSVQLASTLFADVQEDAYPF